jgi:predicted nucleic acid-binding protein
MVAESDIALLDTSAAIALLVEDHEAHAATLAAVGDRRLGLAGHAWFETFSVLTRLPAGLRRSPRDVLRLLEQDFPATEFLDELDQSTLGRELAEIGVSGGAVYDALVGACARRHSRPLVTGDVRARPIYDGLGVRTEVVRVSDA